MENIRIKGLVGLVCLMMAGTWLHAAPTFYFGTVNYHEQFTNASAWTNALNSSDGMLLHVHFWIRKMQVGGDRKVLTDADKIIREIAPALANKTNAIELTFHIRTSSTSPEAIGMEHAKNIRDLEALGIPIGSVNVDYILSIVDVASTMVPEGTEDRGKAMLKIMADMSSRYVKAFRSSGRTEELHAVFPPLYMNEGRWTNARKQERWGLTTSKIIEMLFQAGFSGFTADSPVFVINNPEWQEAGYPDAIRSIANTCLLHGKSFGYIIAGDNQLQGDHYDRQLARDAFAAYDWLIRNKVHPDRLFLESWYKGPYTLVPDNRVGTFTHTAAQLAEKVRSGYTGKDVGILKVTTPAAPAGQEKQLMIRALREKDKSLSSITVTGDTAEIPVGTYVHFIIDVYYKKDGKTVSLVNFGNEGKFSVKKGDAMEAKFEKNAKFVPIISQVERTLAIGTRMPDAAFPIVHAMQTVEGKSESIAPSIKVTLADDEQKIIAQGKQRYG
jgi:hypothetical protein